jgi:hypothetical protein
MIEATKNYTKNLAGTQNKVWEEGYKSQESIYFYPDVLEKEFDFSKGLFAERIRVNTDKKDLPENDTDGNIVHGRITEHKDDFIVVKDKKDKEFKFYKTSKIEIYYGGGQKNVDFRDRRLDPGPFTVSVFYNKGKYFHDTLTFDELNKFGQGYMQQIHPILALVQPVDESGKGQVRLGNWEFSKKDPPADAKFFYFYRPAWPKDEDFSEDFWIAQENLWVQREIYNVIKKANDSVAEFKIVPEKVRKGEVPQKYTCTNPYWEIILQVQRDKTTEKGTSFQATFKNLLPRGQVYDFDLRIYTSKSKLAGGEPLIVKPPGDVDKQFTPMGLSESRKTIVGEGKGEDIRTFTLPLAAPGQEPKDDLATSEILEMWQELSWSTAAVRRIDGIYFSAVSLPGNPESHRDFPSPLMGYFPKRDAQGNVVTSAPEAPAPGKEAKGGPGPGGQPPPPPGPAIKPPAPGPAAPAGPVAGAGVFGNPVNKTRLKQDKERYIEVTQQVRRLPVAVVLNVEQTQVDRVQAAFNNSRLRFQTSQVQLTHTAGSLRPKAATKTGTTPKVDLSTGEELEANVEIVIYGIITIYERYPEKKKPPVDWK